MNQFLEAATLYCRAGLHPIPVEPRGKRPLVNWKEYQNRQPSQAELESWWEQTPDANVALVLGRGTFAVDIDTAEGAKALEDAGVELDPLGDVPSSSTGKGRHFFFAGDAPDRVGLVPGVDIRGVGYVVAPPSIHPTGATYQWVTPIDGALPPAPASLLSLVSKPKAPSSPSQSFGSDWLREALAGVGEGQRDQTCTRLAGYLLGKGLPVEATESLLTAWADRCTPPFPADQVTKCVESIAKREPGPAGPPAPLGDAIDEAMAEIHTPPEKRVFRSTGLGAADKLLAGGFYPGELTYLGARPGVGKTALALQIAARQGKAGTGVLVVSREMTVPALARRLLVQESQVRASVLKTGELIDLERDMLARAAKRLEALPLWLTRGVVKADQLEETMRAYEPGQIGLVIVDYLQLLRGPAELAANKRATVEYVSQKLKDIAVDFNVPVLCLSSLSRPPRDRNGQARDWRPSLADLRESGELEHDADIVLFLHREFDSDLCELIVGKNRDGRVGQVQLRFKGEFLTFEEVSA